MNVADGLSKSAAERPDATALIFRDRKITYAELDREAGKVASALIHLGIEDGDRVALWLPNQPAFVSAMYGAWRVGAIVVPIHALLTSRETSHILEDSGAAVLFCADPHYTESVPGLRGSLPTLDHVVVVGGTPSGSDLDFAGLLQTASGDFPATEVAPDHLALIGYTSGTSGTPKGAMLTHRNLIANMEQMLASPARPEPDDVTLCVLPVFHIYGLNVACNLALRTGSTLMLMERFEPSVARKAVKEHAATIVAAAPPAYVAWLDETDATKDDFASVRLAHSGAAPLPADVLSSFKDRFGVQIWEGYGMTETAPALTSTTMGPIPKAGSIGRPLPGVELRLVAADGEDAEEGDPGEIWVRGPNVFSGYWQHPEENQLVFSDGWFRTGDVAIADEDEDLYIVDRLRDVILVSGFNVYPKEVEDVLLGHPKVSDCAVVGEPDTYSGEHVRAVVTLSSDATDEELLAFCRTRLAPFKVPKRVDVVGSVPRNAAGKLLRRELR